MTTCWNCGQLNDDAVRLEAENRALRAALPDPSKLWALAEWIDVLFPDDVNPEVQADLRRWAREIMALGLHRGITAKEVLESAAELRVRGSETPAGGVEGD